MGPLKDLSFSLAVFTVLIVACGALLYCDHVTTQKDSNRNWSVPMKECIQVCVDHEFKSFHNEGSSWGTGSSSMNGLTQTQIFDRVLKYCDDYYKDEKCCEGDGLPPKNISQIHSYRFGACRRNP